MTHTYHQGPYHDPFLSLQFETPEVPQPEIETSLAEEEYHDVPYPETQLKSSTNVHILENENSFLKFVQSSANLNFISAISKTT